MLNTDNMTQWKNRPDRSILPLLDNRKFIMAAITLLQKLYNTPYMFRVHRHAISARLQQVSCTMLLFREVTDFGLPGLYRRSTQVFCTKYKLIQKFNGTSTELKFHNCRHSTIL
jgi:hypothetical protein